MTVEKTLHVFRYDDTDLVVAESPVDASALYREWSAGEEVAPSEWEQLDGGRLLSVYMNPEADQPLTTQTCREWARRWGRGFLARTER